MRNFSLIIAALAVASVIDTPLGLLRTAYSAAAQGEVMVHTGSGQGLRSSGVTITGSGGAHGAGTNVSAGSGTFGLVVLTNIAPSEPLLGGASDRVISTNASAFRGIIGANDAANLDTGTLPIARVADGAVTLAKQANLAADTIQGRANGAGTGVPQALTPAQARTIISVPIFDSIDPGASALFPLWDDTGNEVDWADAATFRAAIGVGDGTGDVVGPAGATDTAVALFDTSTGKLLKNSVVLIDADGDVTGVKSITGNNTDTTILANTNGITVTNNSVDAPFTVGMPITLRSNATANGTLSVAGVLTQTGNIELNHATANTLSASGGDLSIEGVVVAKRTGGNTFTGAQDLSGASLRLPAAAGSATLSASGAASMNTSDNQIGVHNGTKEVAIPLTRKFPFSFDPKAVCDGAVDRLFLFTVTEPFGITITSWRLSFEADPTTEVDLDLKRADAFIGVANSAVMDVLDTTAGVSSEATAANINGGAVVANGKVVYLEFGTAYSETTHQIIFEITYEIEED